MAITPASGRPAVFNENILHATGFLVDLIHIKHDIIKSVVKNPGLQLKIGSHCNELLFHIPERLLAPRQTIKSHYPCQNGGKKAERYYRRNKPVRADTSGSYCYYLIVAGKPHE